jgi:hypothetical protein
MFSRVFAGGLNHELDVPDPADPIKNLAIQRVTLLCRDGETHRKK